MQSTSLHKPATLPRLLAVVFLQALLLMMTGVSRATSCSTISLTSKPVTCTIPEQTPELTLTATLTGLSFTAYRSQLIVHSPSAGHGADLRRCGPHDSE